LLRLDARFPRQRAAVALLVAPIMCPRRIARGEIRGTS
jgi:hypothetical protein